ncbi:uncharacterized protein EV422DRAFT_622998 [Fimicolochytrium jonesii]|uniref:uncharacterized protein n=1 Tax=Fimicolochytrium jonesii TaxID=1396493 RepID=UPI0022FEF381|nr:uncharacterized protein EV422DRAFT_622998 [Fimicolochytrium jonesii]KAI8816924.1 hypothetical protein EV422DRAFT_622998 [Fimicolochytrium jonesii]
MPSSTVMAVIVTSSSNLLTQNLPLGGPVPRLVLDEGDRVRFCVVGGNGEGMRVREVEGDGSFVSRLGAEDFGKVANGLTKARRLPVGDYWFVATKKDIPDCWFEVVVTPTLQGIDPAITQALTNNSLTALTTGTTDTTTPTHPIARLPPARPT